MPSLPALEIDPASIRGLRLPFCNPHRRRAAVAARGRPTPRLGVETAALAFGLQFQHPVTLSDTILVIPEAGWQCDGVQAMARLSSDTGQRTIRLGGYDTSETPLRCAG
ncbi:MAG: hypothetical protein M9927_10265 [Anaerolineae bacterium]|nr:hypothetical protein [Anaerolineae bacterium]